MSVAARPRERAVAVRAAAGVAQTASSTGSAARRARVQPGVICDQLRDAAEQHHLTYGPDPATHEYCTVGGMIGNNSCGVHSLMAGMTRENVEELDILLYDGTRMTVGAADDEELGRIISAGGRRGEIYTRL